LKKHAPVISKFSSHKSKSNPCQAADQNVDELSAQNKEIGGKW